MSAAEAGVAQRVTCTSHCSTCGSHFHSDGAFDAHRAAGVCLEPMDDGRFAAVAEDAKCELVRVPYSPLEVGNRQVYPAGWQPDDPPLQRLAEPATVWTLARNLGKDFESAGLRGGPKPQRALELSTHLEDR